MRKELDICNLSGQLGIQHEKLADWLKEHGFLSHEAEAEGRSDRTSPPYRLAAPTSLSLAPSTGQPKLFRGRRSMSGRSILPQLRPSRRIGKNY
ncbi:hypothetical protein [Paenibacillus sp. 7516]|uniref:hypothetical protein n=1 Tax=Paenibacillus sp. 7516 TaxID=2022549 RepID=UPI0011409EFD|nr:hypothetical protein [Paenibacillus sp. 7516]